MAPIRSAQRLAEARVVLAAATASRTKHELHVLLVQNTMLAAEIALAEGKAQRAYELAGEAVNTYATMKLPMDEVIARELMTEAALALPDAALARSALDPALELGPGEHLPLALKLRLATLRLQPLSGDKEEAPKAIEELRVEAMGLDYFVIARKAEDALK